MPGPYNAGQAATRTVLVDPTTGNDYVAGGGGGGSTGGTTTNPTFVTSGQNTVTQTTITLAAGTAQTIIPAGATINGARILNWITAPVYLANGTSGTPASGAPSDYIPAAAAGPVPAQFEFAYRPVDGVRAVCASAGTLTVETW